jgi:hypothetical protein
MLRCLLVVCHADGEGWDHEGKHWTNEHETIGHGPLGIQSDYAMTEGLRKVMGIYGGDYAKNAYPIRDHTPTVLRNFQIYRDFYFNEFQRKENTLTYAFWFYGMCCFCGFAAARALALCHFSVRPTDR